MIRVSASPTHTRTWRRRLTHLALRAGGALLPSHRASWAAVMRTEADHIRDDREALRWAWGGICAAAAERLRAAPWRRLLSARAIGLAWIVMFIVSGAYNLSVALAVRLRYEGVASALGAIVRGFRYDRFVPLADAMPWALFALMAFAVALFSLSLYLSVKSRPAAFGAFCWAVGCSLLAWIYQLGIPAYLQVMSPPHRLRIGICFCMTAGVLCALRFGAAPARRSVSGFQRRTR